MEVCALFIRDFKIVVAHLRGLNVGIPVDGILWKIYIGSQYHKTVLR